MTCDANNFLTNFNAYVNGFSGGADSTAFVGTKDKYTLAVGTTQVGALKFRLNGDTTKNVKIPAGATLKVGNGTDPAIVLFQLTGSNQTFLPFDGAGAVDFGTSKGWFVYPKKFNSYYTKPVRLATKISGTCGVVFSGVNANHAADSLNSPNADFSLETANDWAGGTMIDMKAVKVSDKDAFSTGKVTVRGAHLEIVDMNRNDRVGSKGTLPGRRHKFVFCCDNHSLTGGVDILNGATAVLRGANPSLGTGTIAMADGGTLRFENTADLLFANKLEGVGLFQLGGEKEVVFAGDYSELDSGSIDLCGLRHEFSQVPPFALTNTTGRATIAFKGDLGTVDASTLSLLGEPKGFDLAIGAGTLLDLGGQTLTVRRLVEGTTLAQIVNGTLIETNPKRGLLLLVR